MKVDRFLGEVQKPARYVGGEWNEIIKQGPQIAVRMALCYPDIYEVGMSHLGSRILYEVVNRHPHAVCERAFLPWPDYAGQLRRQGLLLTSLETGTPLREFDLIGITLQHELTYPGVVKLLELAGIPIWSEERAERDPLIIGGGPCAAHPEPVAPFFDALVVGDGEEVLVEIIEVCLEHSDRAGRLSALAHLPGVYVPALYEATRGCPVPKTKAAPPKIQRRIVLDLDAAPYPLRPIVPFVEIVHDRVQLEINRGCTHGCRFCQAGILYRPVRQRSLETLRRYARELLTKTGYEQISLASLSCTDYPHIIELVDAITTDFGEQRVSISLPSLRTDQFGIELARRVSRARKSPVTLAPEAGSQRLRDVINKNVTEANLQAAVRAAFRAGWHSVKLYFMIGLPTETDEDVLAIAETVREVAAIGRQELGSKKGRLRIPVTIAGFVPKPHSVFESVRQCSRQELAYKQGLLREALRDKCVDLKFGAVEQTALEGILARGGRWLAPAIAAVANQGEGLEVWGEWQSLARWEAALAELGTSLDEEVGHEVREVATSPWGHIDVGVSWEFRARERERALAGQPTPDCRESRCHQCGLQKHCQKSATPIPLRLQNKGGKCRRSPRNASEQSGPACQAIITFAKREKVRWLAHLDLSRAFQRAFRRAGLPVAYTLGFHQRPRMTIARPLPVGATGEAELLAIDLIEVWPAERIAKALAATLPQGLALREVVVQQKENRSPFARLVRACYEISLEGPSTTQLAAALTKVLETSTIEVKRRTKRGQQTVDIRAGLLEAEVVEQPLGLRFLLACSDAYLVKPDEVIEVVNRYLCDTGSPPVAVVHMHRRCLVMDDDHSLDRREAELSRIAHA